MTKKAKKKISIIKNTKPPVKKINLLDMHINRKKFDILGMKSKSERGLPGISRAKSLKKRMSTLLQEYKLKDKNNLFYDKRIGERNTAMTAEDKITARFAAERMKIHSKKSVYNLGENEELTHKGQTLTAIERFDDPKSEDEDDEESGRLDSNFVEDAHFGGGLFKKVGEAKSQKDLIDQLIAESIKRKVEKQKNKQLTYELVEKLDSDWKELLPLVTETKKKKSDIIEENKEDDKFANYDIFSKKLKFEARGKPSDKLKSKEEIAQEEKARLEQLEKERIERMLGATSIKEKIIQHRSADDIDDGFEFENKSQAVLAYNNGVLNINNEDNSDIEYKFKENKEKTNESETEESEVLSKIGSDSENELLDKNEGIEEDGKCEIKIKQNPFKNEENKEPDQSIKNKDEFSKSLSKTNLEKEENNAKNIRKNKIEKNDAELNNNANETKADGKELPFTFEIPKSYEEFEVLINNYDIDQQSIILERMIKCHHPSLKEIYKEDLDALFTFLLQYILNCASKDNEKINSFKTLDKFAPWLFDLLQWNVYSCSSTIINVLKQRFRDYCENSKTYPPLDTLIFFKVVSLLFPTSDYRHPIVTPTLIFMKKILFQANIESSTDLSIGLFIATLVLEYCSFAKRYSPEVINFLHCVFRLAHPKDSDLPIRMPLKLKIFDRFDLIVGDKSREAECNPLCTRNLLIPDSCEDFKINAISLALKLLSEFCDFWTEGQPAILVFESFIPLLDSGSLPLCLKSKIDEVLQKIMKFKTANLKKLVWQKKKPKPLRLYEPNIEEVYNLKRHQPMGKKKRERAKLLHKYKKEMKGALREIRRDRSFLCNIKYKEIMRSDMDRKRKVQEILSSAAEQQGDLRKIQRKKK